MAMREKTQLRSKKMSMSIVFKVFPIQFFFVVMESIMDFVFVLAWLTKQPKEIVYIQNTLKHFKAHVL